MRSPSRALALLCVLCAICLCATPAYAQATRTWVSGVGDDVNPCSRTAPCKTFAGAISKTAAGGEIDAMDDGGFGAVTITKSITIDGGGHLASILASGTNGVNVNGAGIVVTLRRLQINGGGTGLVGVNVFSGSHVNIEHCEIFDFGGTPGHGVSVAAASGASLSISNSRIEHNDGSGVVFAAGTAAIVSSSLVKNGYAGVDVNGTGPVVLVSNSTLAWNGRGIHTGGTATVRMTHLDIAFNTAYAWEITSGIIQTHVDNRIIGTGLGTLTPMSFAP